MTFLGPLDILQYIHQGFLTDLSLIGKFFQDHPVLSGQDLNASVFACVHSPQGAKGSTL